MTVKINTRHAFPPTLDLAPFTKRAVEREEAAAAAAAAAAATAALRTQGNTDDGADEDHGAAFPADAASAVPAKDGAVATKRALYRIVGIVNHRGNANRGHYYSFIRRRSDDSVPFGAEASSARERTPGASSHGSASAAAAENGATAAMGSGRSATGASGDWFEFNDSIVRPWDFQASVEEACFGGDVTRMEENAVGTFTERVRRLEKSAYMLLYERIDGDGDGDGGGGGGGEVTEAASVAGVVDDGDHVVATSALLSPAALSLTSRTVVPPHLFRAVWRDNRVFAQVSLYVMSVTFHANPAHNLTRSPNILCSSSPSTNTRCTPPSSASSQMSSRQRPASRARTRSGAARLSARCSARRPSSR